MADRAEACTADACAEVRGEMAVVVRRGGRGGGAGPGAYDAHPVWLRTDDPEREGKVLLFAQHLDGNMVSCLRSELSRDKRPQCR